VGPGTYQITGGGVAVANNGLDFRCYGIKITVTHRVTADGKTYEPGTKLTVDAHKRLIQVSGWN